jgi:hypothetical protein
MRKNLKQNGSHKTKLYNVHFREKGHHLQFTKTLAFTSSLPASNEILMPCKSDSSQCGRRN